MNLGEIEENIQGVIQNLSRDEFIFDLMLSYGMPKASITRLKDGAYNLFRKRSGTLSEGGREILWKKKLYFKEVFDKDLHASIDHASRDPDIAKQNPRFIIVTDYKTLLALDVKEGDTLDIAINELPKRFDFFLPWSGREKSHPKLESAADVKAAEKMARLYDLIRQDNPDLFHDRESFHQLNVFLSRLLFCYFAEDTEIFPKKLFVNSVSSHTAADGSDLSEYLNRLFKVLNTEQALRGDIPEYLKKFEYVNGGLFAHDFPAPDFSPRSRKLLIECAELNWADINPDIFGSMMQAVVHTDHRANMGMHYTSVSNIMKVIEPLFLDELYTEFGKSFSNIQKLERLLGRMSAIRIFDPACGSGNFLIISYKELRTLEIKILEQMRLLGNSNQELFSRINLSQFFGIELDDFAHEIAILSLWLAEHQMNVKFNEVLQKKLPALPLKQSGKILCENATRYDWNDACPNDGKAEIYILGNPPYLGARIQNKEHKADISIALKELKGANSLDYISCWFYIASKYIENTKAKCAFVSTNSICQGEQVALLWPKIFDHKVEISFAHLSFKWSNNAKRNAGVICIIVGLSEISKNEKYIYKDATFRKVDFINAYLTPSPNVFIFRRSKPISKIPALVFGNMPNDGGNLILSKKERDDLLKEAPKASKFIKQFVGAQEFLNGNERWCLFINDADLPLAMSIDGIRRRIMLTAENRKKSKRPATKILANTPHKFGFVSHKSGTALIVPSATSERRDYIPIGLVDDDVVISNLAHAVYGADPYIFGLLSSAMHMAWVRSVAGRLKTDYRYSGAICYNNFPIPDLTEKQKENVAMHSFNVLEERERHSEKTLAQLYDPKKMPSGLLEAHQGLDQAVERCYRLKPFINDEDRLEVLFKHYAEMISKKASRTEDA